MGLLCLLLCFPTLFLSQHKLKIALLGNLLTEILLFQTLLAIPGPRESLMLVHQLGCFSLACPVKGRYDGLHHSHNVSVFPPCWKIKLPAPQRPLASDTSLTLRFHLGAASLQAIVCVHQLALLLP